MTAEAKGVAAEHPQVKGFFEKFMKDNVGFLASAVAWSVLTSIVPIIVGLLAIAGIVMRNKSTQQSVVSHVSQALQGVLTTKDIQHIVTVSTQHAGLLGIVGFLGILWGGSNVGGSISTVFQPIFQVAGRNFFKEKLIDIGMIFVFAILMIVIVVGTAGASLVGSLFSSVPLPSGVIPFAIGTAVSVLAAFLLFATIYLVFPNANPGLKFRSVWPGAFLAAVLFEVLTYIFPLYTHFAHFQKYGSLLASLLLLTAWIYFFAMILLVGAEIVAFQALREAREEHKSIGPAPDGTVPQRMGNMRSGETEQQPNDAKNRAS